MLDSFIFVVMPYAALALLIFVTPYRYYSNRLTWTAYSTQFLEKNTLYWGSVPWHFGILLVLLGHLAGVVCPHAMHRLLANQQLLVLLESVGLACGLLALMGSVLLLLRRVNKGILKQVTFCSDWVLLYLLVMQAATGIYIATAMRWGSVWYLDTAVPYFYSLLSFKPELGYVADFPLIFKLHSAGAFLILALLPFTKLVHLLFSPVAFLRDAPILYRWRGNRF